MQSASLTAAVCLTAAASSASVLLSDGPFGLFMGDVVRIWSSLTHSDAGASDAESDPLAATLPCNRSGGTPAAAQPSADASQCGQRAAPWELARLMLR